MHFLRGLLDGDGNVRSILDRSLGISFAGNIHLMTEIRDRICSILGIQNRDLYPVGKIWSLQFTGEDACKVIQKIYPNKKLFGLPRKRDFAIDRVQLFYQSQHCSVCNINIGFRRRVSSIQYCEKCRAEKQREANRRSYRKKTSTHLR